MQLRIIQNKIFEIREQKVMFDFDLAELYEVETRILNQAVKRNIDRFPDRFMFKLTAKEWNNLRSQIIISSGVKNNSSQIVMSSRKHRGSRYLPYAFTEHGVTMLASVLRSKKAIKMNIAIVEAFIALKQFALTYAELAAKIAKMERKNNKQFKDVYEALNLLLSDKESQADWEKREKIGFKK